MPNKFSILNDEDDDITVQQIQPIVSVITDDKPSTISKKKQFSIIDIDDVKIGLESVSIRNESNNEWVYKAKQREPHHNNWTSNNKPTYASRTRENINMIPQNTDSKKKSFSQPVVQRTETIKLPDYYKMRVGEEQNIYEIPQAEYDWIKRVGALEKANSVGEMWNGIMACAIGYYENKQFLQRNKFFANKLTSELAFNQSKQDELMELICIQTTAILFHRLVKSDSAETVKILLNSLPLYKAVPGNPVDMTNLSRSNGANAYLRVRHNFINDLRVVQNKKGISEKSDIADASLRIKNTETKWLEYILQSVWNGNNPIHDCLYYGACTSFECLLEQYLKLNMHVELNIMMLQANIQNETHVDIVKNGRKACEKQSSFIIRNIQFEECEKLYNRTIEMLKNYKKDSDIFETDESSTSTSSTSSSTLSTSTSTSTSTLTSISEGDNVNVYSLINNGDIDGMIAHINRNKNNPTIINKTLEIWQSTVDMDKTGQLVDYLEDLKYQTKSIIDNL
jgi:hypothetical protein